MKLKQNQKLSQKPNKLLFGCFLLLGWILHASCFASVIELTVQPNTSLFYFSLPANPTTGYQWSVQSYDRKILRFSHSNYKSTNTQLIGSGGVERFYFNVLKPGQPIDTSIELMYARPWEDKPIKTQKIHLNTKK